MGDLHRVVAGSLKENCYIVARGGDAVVIDPGGAVEEIVAHVTDRGWRVRAVLSTHGHADHLAAVVPIVEEYGAPFHMHPADAYLLPRANFYRQFVHGEAKIRIPRIDVSLEGVDSLLFGSLEIGVLHTPGHTPGSVCFRFENELFTGDTLAAGHLGRTDLPGGDRKALEGSLTMLASTCPPDVTIRPGHGEAARAGALLANWASLAEVGG